MRTIIAAAALAALSISLALATPARSQISTDLLRKFPEIKQEHPELARQLALANECVTFTASGFDVATRADADMAPDAQRDLSRTLVELHRAALMLIAVMSLPEATMAYRGVGMDFLTMCAERARRTRQ